MIVCFSILMRTYWIWHLNQARRRGLYPLKDKPTLFDVKELLLKGEKESAIRVYCQIFGSNYSEAKKAVEELERSLKA